MISFVYSFCKLVILLVKAFEKSNKHTVNDCVSYWTEQQVKNENWLRVHKGMAYFVLLILLLLLLLVCCSPFTCCYCKSWRAETMSLQSLNLFRLISVFVIIHPLSSLHLLRTILLLLQLAGDFSVLCVCFFPLLLLAPSFLYLLSIILVLSVSRSYQFFG